VREFLSSSGIDVSSANDQLEEEGTRQNGTRQNVTVHCDDYRQMVSSQVSGDRLQEVQGQRVEKALANHEGVLRPLCRGRIAGQVVSLDRGNGNHAKLAEKIPGPSGTGGSIDNRNVEKGIPAPDLGLGENKVKEDLEI
jgi:hypothetical protein